MRMRRALLALGFVVSALLAATPTAALAQDIACDPGDQEVASVDFIGNRTFDDEQLAIGMITTNITNQNTRFASTREGLKCDPDRSTACMTPPRSSR